MRARRPRENAVPIHLVGLNVRRMTLHHGCLCMDFHRTRDPDAFEYYEGVSRRLIQSTSKFDAIRLYVVSACDEAIIEDWLSSLGRTRECVLVTCSAPSVLMVAQARKPMVSAYRELNAQRLMWLSPDKTIKYYIPVTLRPTSPMPCVNVHLLPDPEPLDATEEHMIRPRVSQSPVRKRRRPRFVDEEECTAEH